jgi:tetratricopeptide (TPR) repeat protein
MGQFDKSITEYRKALAIDPSFTPSRSGIAAALTYLGKPDEAAAELEQILDKARGDNDRRAAILGLATVYADGGKMEAALAEVDKLYALGEKISDQVAMAGDLQIRGAILIEMGRHREAKDAFERALKLIEGSAQSQELKDNAKLQHRYNLATVGLGDADRSAAKAEAEEFRKGAEASKNPAQVRQSHQLAGIIALAEKQYDRAIAELEQAGTQNPQDLYRLCQAYQGKGDGARAKELCEKAAGFNSLLQLNYAFIRTKARKLGAT